MRCLGVDQTRPRPVSCLRLRVSAEFVLQIGEGVLVELKFALECPIGHAAPPSQEVHHLVQDLIEPHRVAPLFY